MDKYTVICERPSEALAMIELLRAVDRVELIVFNEHDHVVVPLTKKDD